MSSKTFNQLPYPNTSPVFPSIKASVPTLSPSLIPHITIMKLSPITKPLLTTAKRHAQGGRVNPHHARAFRKHVHEDTRTSNLPTPNSVQARGISITNLPRITRLV